MHTHPQIWKEISRGLCDINKYKIKIKTTTIYGAAYVNGELIGIGSVIRARNGNYYAHLQLLPQYRNKHHMEFGIKMLSLLWDTSGVDTVYIRLHSDLRHIKVYAQKLGFKVVSFDYHPLSVFNKPCATKKWLLKLDRDQFNVRCNRLSR